jgi:hypothetical protein
MAWRDVGFVPGVGGTTWPAPLSVEQKQWIQTAKQAISLTENWATGVDEYNRDLSPTILAIFAY